jgi:hypothetical protein
MARQVTGAKLVAAYLVMAGLVRDKPEFCPCYVCSLYVSGCSTAGNGDTPHVSAITLTCAATMRQPCGKRTQVCIWRPTFPDMVGR